MLLPKDPFILLSFINTKLRDEFNSLDELCDGLMVEKKDITSALENIGYTYNYDKNAFC